MSETAENTTMQAVLKEKQQQLVDAIKPKSKSYLAKLKEDQALSKGNTTKGKAAKGNTTKGKESTPQESTDDDYSSDDDYSTDEDYMDLETIINEQNAKITALEEKMAELMEQPQQPSA